MKSSLKFCKNWWQKRKVGCQQSRKCRRLAHNGRATISSGFHATGDPVLKSCIWLANNWLGLLHDSRDGNTLLSADEIEQAVAVGNLPGLLSQIALEVQKLLPIFAFQPETEISRSLALL